MKSIGQLFSSGDWKGEKHVPVIHCPDEVTKNESFDIKISIGDAVKHPNTFEHYISWFKVFFHPEGGKFPIELATFDFSAHGESENFTGYVGLTEVQLSKSGTIYAVSYCNIHGLWENSKEVTVKE
ncbi:class II SORL domain-containing protein [Serpentinicella sp. ANB-PHB4]|uniref:class II SORL domain-containing protein n=1 Tax=Serpentinicella sp. ANB-PHB4 TaxID=3074076 RepID=UPI00285AC494|nr:class II SORL domain-containing protein [Serpentinicella sp. ANB-PHB4]MDR5659162.1 class II SORL domain-containing protein [Serpentinicella sp. ANB-PHB4]